MIWRTLGVILVIALIAVVANASFAMLAESYAASFKGEERTAPKHVRVAARLIRVVGVICVVSIALLVLAWAFG